MAAFLGGLFGVLLCLLIVGGALATPAVILAHYLIKLRRQWRRWQAERRPHQPYDDAYERAIWDTGAANGYRDGLERVRNPQLPSGSP